MGEIDRRQVLKVGAWTVPAVAVAVAAPAATASPSPTNALMLVVTQLDFPRQGVTSFQILVRNLSTDTIRVSVTGTLVAEHLGIGASETERWGSPGLPTSPDYVTSNAILYPRETLDGLTFNVVHPYNGPQEPLPYTITIIASSPGMADGMWAHTDTSTPPSRT